jgi:hypothetical protein
MRLHFRDGFLQVSLYRSILSRRDRLGLQLLNVRLMVGNLVLNERAIEVSARLALKVRRHRGTICRGNAAALRRRQGHIQLLRQATELLPVLAVVGGQLRAICLTLGERAFFAASVASWISVVFATFIWERIAAGLEAVALESTVVAAVLSLRGEPLAPEGIVSRVLSPPAPPSTIPVSVFLLLPEEQDTSAAITTTGIKTVRIIEPPE